MKEFVYHGATASDIKDVAISDGMSTLMQDSIEKLLKGQTDMA